MGLRVRRDRAIQGRPRHRGLLRQSDDPRAGLHQLRPDAASSAGDQADDVSRLPLRMLRLLRQEVRLSDAAQRSGAVVAAESRLLL